MTAIGVILVLGGIFAFFNFRSIAKSQATQEATTIAHIVAERVANEYLQRELPNIIEEYKEMPDSGGTSDDDADLIAGAQDNLTEGDVK